MEKTIKWESSEDMQLKVIENEKTQVLAKIGVLMMDLDNAKRDLESINGRQKAIFQQAIQNKGITQFESARPIPGGIVLQIPEGNGNV